MQSEESDASNPEVEESASTALLTSALHLPARGDDDSDREENSLSGNVEDRPARGQDVAEDEAVEDGEDRERVEAPAAPAMPDGGCGESRGSAATHMPEEAVLGEDEGGEGKSWEAASVATAVDGVYGEEPPPAVVVGADGVAPGDQPQDQTSESGILKTVATEEAEQVSDGSSSDAPSSVQGRQQKESSTTGVVGLVGEEVPDESASDDIKKSSANSEDWRNVDVHVYTRRARTVVAALCSVLGLTSFILSTVLTYQIALPGIQHVFFKSLTISNATEGFRTSQVLPGLYKSWYFWNITNPSNYLKGTEPPSLEQVGPYTMQQVVKVTAVSFSRQQDEVFRSTVVYGVYDADKSCATCSLDDSVTVVNEIFMATMASLNTTDIELLRTFVPGLITDALQHIEGYLTKQGKTPAAAKTQALQQFRDCSVLKGKSIRTVDPTYKWQQFPPEYCAWAKFKNIKFAPLVMNDTEFKFFMSLVFSGQPDSVSSILRTINPELGFFRNLSWLGYQLSIGILEYLNYMTSNPAKALFTEAVINNNGGLIITRPVKELLYGYYDPWLQFIYGNGSDTAWVTQIHSQDAVEKPTRPFPEAQGRMGIKTGAVDISKLYWITQQGTVMKTSPAAFNARVVQWEYGNVTVEASSGLCFGPLKVVRGQNVTMWLDNWLRHVTLQYVGVGHVHGLATYKYTLDLSSLDVCHATPPLRITHTEGPCMYPNRYRGLINMSRFQDAVFQTLPHFYGADPHVAATLGYNSQAMQPDERYNLTMDIEPSFGASVNLSLWFQKVFQVKRMTLLYPSLWLLQSKSSGPFSDSVWIPHSYYHIEATANKSVCDALSAGTSIFSAVVFFMINFVPFVSVGCIVCGLQCLWRRRQMKLCYMICLEGKTEDAEPPELITAVVMDPTRLREFLAGQNRIEARQKAELSWRRFNEHISEHSRDHERIKKQHAEHRNSVREEREAREKATSAALEEQARKDGLKEAVSAGELEQTRETGEERSNLRAHAVSLIESDEPFTKGQLKLSTAVSKQPLRALGEEGYTSPREGGTEWSRTASLFETSGPDGRSVMEWSRTASVIEASGSDTHDSREWSRTFSTVEAEDSSHDVITHWSRTASLIEAEEGRLQRRFRSTQGPRLWMPSTTPIPESRVELLEEPDPEPQSEPAPEPQREPDPEPQREPDPEPQRDPDPEPHREPGPQPHLEPHPEPNREPDSEPNREPDPQADPESNSGLNSGPISEPDQEPSDKHGAQQDAGKKVTFAED